MKNYKKILNRILLICGIIGFCFLPAFQDFYIKSYPMDFASLVADIVLILMIAILSYFPRLRILTIVLAIILMKNARKSPYFNAGMDRAKLT